jgi:hypothetical protein
MKPSLSLKRVLPLSALAVVLLLSGCSFFMEWGFIPPDTPAGLTAATTDTTTITVSWSSTTGATSYQLFRAPESTGPWTSQVYTGKELSFSDTGLDPSTTYYYAVRATNAAGSSDLSAAVSGATDKGTVAEPVISPASNNDVSGPVTVTIACETDGAAIYYTNDGSAPDTGSTKYTGSFSFQTDHAPPEVISAIAVKDGWNDSAVVVATYSWGW